MDSFESLFQQVAGFITPIDQGFSGLLLSAVLGGLISLGLYRRSSQQLVREANSLRKQNALVLRWLEKGGKGIALERDEMGEISRVIISPSETFVEAVQSGGAVISGGSLKSVDEPG